MSAAISVPVIGEPLPRAEDAYAAREKLEWILAEHGHGREWTRVLKIRLDDAGPLWRGIAQAVLDAPVSAIRDFSPFGVGCEVRIVLTLNARLTPVVTAWHYDKAVSAPRLITAYPTPKMWNRCQQSVRSQP
jgi:hypothetical protein